MKKLDLNQIRKEYLEFFREKEHIVLKSYPLIPQDDKSLLLVNAGMAPLKKYFTGELKMAKNRAASSQRCIRTADIESVGKTQRHGTFFEMLGNFSFGDYFKKEAITWAWEFLTERLEIPEELLWPSVYEEDDEAYDLWKDMIGVPEERIVRLGKEDNFWELEQGPCGPCSEIYVDRGEKYGCGDPDCKPGCECDRFMEVWNLVFTQFNKDENGNYNRLANPNIDTGMGLERITLVLEAADNIFEIGLIKDIIHKIESVSNVKYHDSEKNDISIRIIADHTRAMTFLVYDGVIPSNEGRGYVLRRLIRRAARHGKLLGIKDNFLNTIVESVMEAYVSEYPELKENQDRIKKIVASEEKKFQETLDQGLEKLSEVIDNSIKNGIETIGGADAFRLYDTYGFPIDLTMEILEEKGLNVDLEEFESNMEAQRVRSRDARNESNIGWSGENTDFLKEIEKTIFTGYSQLSSKAKIIQLFVDNKPVDVINAGQQGIIILESTSFYGESGGQVGDTGKIENDNFMSNVLTTKKNKNEGIIHYVEVVDGSAKVGDIVQGTVDLQTRRDIMKNHSATHLLHKALKEVLGNHINQAGSYVDSKRLRFDITHFEAISKEDIERIESIVNQQISLGLEVSTQEMTIEDSAKAGAVGLFEDKYKDIVRVVSMGDGYSVELCGGTHVKTTSDIQMFKILSESSVAAGIRRIEAITGRSVYSYMKDNEKFIDDLSNVVKAKKDDIISKVQLLQEEIKRKEREIQKINTENSQKSLDSILENVKSVEGFKIAINGYNDMDMETLRNLCDEIKTKIGSGTVVLANTVNDKVNFIVAVTDDMISRGVNAGNVVREVAKITGGNGGGRKDFASAGGKDVSKVADALAKATEIVEGMLK